MHTHGLERIWQNVNSSILREKLETSKHQENEFFGGKSHSLLREEFQGRLAKMKAPNKLSYSIAHWRFRWPPNSLAEKLTRSEGITMGRKYT